MLRDLPLDELRRYQPAVAEPADFAEFWAAELAAAARGRYDPALPGQAGLPQQAGQCPRLMIVVNLGW